MAKPPNGLSRRAGTRRRQEKVLEAYAEQAASIGGDPERDRQAKIVAVERAGYTRANTDQAKLRQFMRLWKSDESRAYLCELWGMAIEKEPDPVGLAMRMLHEHMVQDDVERWGARDRAVSLAATRTAVAIFIPNQTSKVMTASMSMKVERPAAYDQEPVMAARTILPAGQKLTKPVAPTGGDDLDEEDDDDNEPG